MKNFILAAIIFLTTTCFSQLKMERIQSNKLATSKAPITTAIKANGFLFISGQLGYDSSGKLVDGFEAETKQVLENIGIIIRESNLGYKDIVSITIYIKDMSNFTKMNEIYRPYFDGLFPTRTCIAVADLPMNGNIEMTVTALVN
jgi:2-iminobutanoate/2-iminopropanoate deaminase